MRGGGLGSRPIFKKFTHEGIAFPFSLEMKALPLAIQCERNAALSSEFLIAR